MALREMHGGHEFHFEGNLLIAKSWGAWNLEKILSVQDDWKQEILKRNLPVWGSCIDCREWELSTPDAWDEIFIFSKWTYDHGCRFNGNSFSKKMITNMVGEAIDETAPLVEFQAFENHDECLAWCQKKADEYLKLS